MEKSLQVILQSVLDVPDDEDEAERLTVNGDFDLKTEQSLDQPQRQRLPPRSCRQGLSIIACNFIARALFYPSLLQLYLATKLSSCEWYSRIDENVCLGALPTGDHFAQRLIFAEKIVGVVSMNEDYELRRFPVQWAKHGVEFLQLATRDIVDAPSQVKIRQAIEFMERLCLRDVDSNGSEPKNSVYVHCKAGRTRSATVVVCFLIKKYDWNPAEAIAHVTEKRRNVLLGPRQRAAIEKFYRSIKRANADLVSSVQTINVKIP